MSSKFRYLRPRLIPGNYIVQIDLDLAATEEAEVFVSRVRPFHCGSCGRQEPVSVKVKPHSPRPAEFLNLGMQEARIETYSIGQIIVGDTIEVIIRDVNVVPVQHTRHTASVEAYDHEVLPYTHNGSVWRIVPLNLLALIDHDYASMPF